MQDQKRSLIEAVSKELKAVDKKKLDRINNLLRTSIKDDAVIRFVT